MGSKGPLNQRLRRGGYKCEFCGRALLSIQSLRTHQRTLHAIALKEREKRKINRTRPQKPQKISLKAPEKVKILKMPSDAAKPGKSRTMVKTKAKSSLKETKIVRDKKVEFKCPKCDEIFSVYFPAMRHIQKNHCVNSKGESVEPTSHDLIKPLRVEICLHCNSTIPPDTHHQCQESPAESTDVLSYKCVDCKQTFNNVKLFDIHVSGVHSDGLENMFFPSNIEFMAWKKEVENQTKVEYLLLGKYNSKQIYRCSGYSPEDDLKGIAEFCPSTIVRQEFPNGVQVHFYKHHSGHSHEDYQLLEQFKKYSITGLLQQAAGYTDIDIKHDENDLYLQFKTLMESIVFDAAKLNIATLKILIGKALEMTMVLTNYEEDGDITTENRYTVKSDKNDDDISKVLEMLSSPKQKRNSVASLDVPAKRLRSNKSDEAKSPILQKGNKTLKISNSFSLSNDKDSDKILKALSNKNEIDVKSTKTPDLTPATPKFDQSPSSFNDSYKNFVDKSYNYKNVKKNTPNSAKKAVPATVKTQINTDDTSQSSTSTQSSKVVASKTPQPNKKNTQENSNRKSLQDNTNKRKTDKKKSVMKTKIGQYKPITPPKMKNVPSVKPKLKETTNVSIASKIKDIQYEVKEQENDCNILILKI